MARATVRDLTDRILGGTLDDWLTAQRADGLSFAQIAWALRDEHDIAVTAETVRSWCDPTADTAT